MGKQLPGQDEGVPLPDSIPTPALPKRLALGRWAGLWAIRLLKILLVGLSTCGLGWVWLAMFVYYERFKRRRALSSRRGHR